MTLFQGLLLGAIQGTTEFLPVSSSAHLVFAKSIFGIRTAGASLEVALHLGTLLSVLVLLRKDVVGILAYLFSSRRKKRAHGIDERERVLGIIVGTLPAVIIGLTFKSALESTFSKPDFAGIALFLTGVFLLVTRRKSGEGREARKRDWLYVGLAQAVAILPGISRSGSTIGTGILLGLRRETALKMSFLLSIVAIAGAAVVELPKISQAEVIAPAYLIASAISSFLFGCLSVLALFRLVRRGAFEYFGVYCLVAGVLASLYFLR
ncbi:MAG: undecaprenyl-diphosphate phosphatase [Candidatus Eisenbacteria bacterium]|nr:undecaprenyl-diphosphate phosphatase [Candidatus Eisenbacteria bacterium]